MDNTGTIQNTHNTQNNKKKAKTLLEKGCARSYGPACFNLAVMYKNGDDGVPKSVLPSPLRMHAVPCRV